MKQHQLLLEQILIIINLQWLIMVFEFHQKFMLKYLYNYIIYIPGPNSTESGDFVLMTGSPTVKPALLIKNYLYKYLHNII